MALNKLLTASAKLLAVRDRIEALKEEKQRLQAKIAAINDQLSSARADSDALIVEVKAEALDTVSP